MNHMDEDFSPVRKSTIAVNYDDIIQDTKSDHNQMSKLKNIMLIPRAMHDYKSPLVTLEKPENVKLATSTIKTPLLPIRNVLSRQTNNKKQDISSRNIPEKRNALKSSSSRESKVTKPRKKTPRQPLVFDSQRLSKIIAQTSPNATPSNVQVKQKPTFNEPVIAPERLNKIIGHKQGLIPLLTRRLEPNAKGKAKPQLSIRDEDSGSNLESREGSELSNSMEISDSSSLLEDSESSSTIENAKSLQNAEDDGLSLASIEDNQEFMTQLNKVMKRWQFPKNDCSCPTYFAEAEKSVISVVERAIDSSSPNKPVVFQGFYKHSYGLIETIAKKVCISKNVQIMKISIPSLASNQTGKEQGGSRKVSLDFPNDTLKKQFFHDIGKNFNLRNITNTILQSMGNINSNDGEKKTDYITFVSARDIDAIDMPAMRSYWKIINEVLQTAKTPVLVLGFRHISGKPSQIPSFLENVDIINIKPIKSLKEFQSRFIELLEMDNEEDSRNVLIHRWRSDLNVTMQNTKSFLYFLTRITYVSGEGPLSALFALQQSINHCKDYNSVYKLLNSVTKGRD